MKRNGAIDLMRFVFTVTIVLFHAKNFAGEGERIFLNGAIGVEFFFLVSGYLMAQSASRIKSTGVSIGNETARFIFDKVKKLLPNFYVAWVIAFAVMWIWQDYTMTEVVRKAAFSIFDWTFLVQAGLAGHRANTVTWYLSAMVLSMAMLYPLLLRYRETFLKVIAPLLSIFLFGYMFKEWTAAFGGPSVWQGFMTKGLTRAIAEVSLGTVLWTLNQKLIKLNPTKLMSALLSISAIGAYALVLVHAWGRAHSQWDYILLILLAYGVLITFSGKGLVAPKLTHPIFGWLGAFSFNLYLGHGFWSHALEDFFPNLPYGQQLAIYGALATVTALVIMYVSKLLQYLWKKYWPSLKPAFFKVEDALTVQD